MNVELADHTVSSSGNPNAVVSVPETHAGVLQDALRSVFEHLLTLATGPLEDVVTAELGRIRDEFAAGLDLQALEKRLGGLRLAFEQRSAREEGQRGGELSSAQETALPQILIRLVQRLPLPAEMAPAAEELVLRLEAETGGDAVVSALEAAWGLVLDLRARAEQEKKALEALLVEVTAELETFDRGLASTRQETDAGFQASRALEQFVRAEMEDLRHSAQESTGVESLRASVGQAMRAIGTHLEANRVAEMAREERLRREAEQLRLTVERLEAEVAEYQRRTQTERERSLRDPLTGCWNRLAYDERLALEEARWRRYGSPLSVILIDIDRFKSVNDTFGHPVGDQVLKAIAEIAAAQIRETDFFGRYGGDEFVALLPETDLEGARPVADKIRAAAEAFLLASCGEQVAFTVSCGVAQLAGEDTVGRALDRADRALYAAKVAGRNRSVTERELS